MYNIVSYILQFHIFFDCPELDCLTNLYTLL